MKMAKKLLAVVLAGVLALSVLTGCGNAASTKTIADVLSDMSKGQEIVYKADSKLNGKAKELGEYAVKFAKDHEDEGEDFDYSGELNKGIMADVMKDYKDKFVYIAETETKGYNATAQAYTLLRHCMVVMMMVISTVQSSGRAKNLQTSVTSALLLSKWRVRPGVLLLSLRMLKKSKSLRRTNSFHP